MNLIAFLICFPFLAALMLFVTKDDTLRKFIVICSSVGITIVAIAFSIGGILDGDKVQLLKETKVIDEVMLVLELVLMVFIVFLSVKYKKYYVAILSLVQTGMIVWLEKFAHHETEELFHIYSDRFTSIMIIVVAVVGCLICVYALGYMKDYHHHHTEYGDRRPFFFALLFVFLGAMFGLLLSNNLIWMYFFWEITSVCSFLLIGYTKTKEATNNSFRALWMNLLGGLGFAVAIVYGALVADIVTLQQVAEKGPIICVALLAFAGLTKSAQFPFSGWLLGAMVAPTPTSALLHSATMVNAGVYLLIRVSPQLAGNYAGAMVSLIGGFTFLVASMLAISQSDGKKVLAYSTISNLGLITACAGIGQPESVWAGILLIIFHAVSKALLFQSVGAIENESHSRDIEDMHGLLIRHPYLAYVMIIGICGMFLAPFGMLISKWAALKSFIDSGSIIQVIFIAFGSATTMFYWTKWLAKIVSMPSRMKTYPNTTKVTEWVSLITHAVLVIVLCFTFPFISNSLVEPMLEDMFGGKISSIISSGNMIIMLVMLCLIFVLPILSRILTRGTKYKVELSYMGGINTGENRAFVDSFGEEKQMYLSSWYLDDYFSEKKLWLISIILSSAILVINLVLAIGGAL